MVENPDSVRWRERRREERRGAIRDSPKSTKGAVVHSGYKFVLRLLVLIFHEKINKLCTVEINQTFLHHLSISFRGNDDEHPVILLVPCRGPNILVFFLRSKKTPKCRGLWYKKYYRKSRHQANPVSDGE